MDLPAQGWNWGLLHCRWILYQLSYQENPRKRITKGTCQDQCPYGRTNSPKWLPLVFMFLEWVPVSSKKLTQINRWVWSSLLSNHFYCLGSYNVWNFVCTFKNGVSISHSFLTLLYVSLAGFQSQILLGFFFFFSQCRTPRLGKLMWGSDLCSLGRASAVVIILLFVSCPPMGMGTDCIMTLCLLPIVIFHILSSRWSFLLVFLSFFSAVV